MMTKILEVNNLHFAYGEIKVLHGISFYVGTGEIVTLLGANGAGKTTTLRTISGLIQGMSEGEIAFVGNSITRKKPHDISTQGLAQCLEGRHVFTNLTVRENLMMGAYSRKDKLEIKQDMEYVYELFPRLLERQNQSAGTLSGGEQQMLAVGRALMQKPKLIMMDEPSLGLAPIIIQDIFNIIRQINQNGMPVLLIEQNSSAALEIADRGYVMENGRIVLSGTAEFLRNNEDVKNSYLGGKRS